MSYQPEERYWTDYLRIALPVVGLLLMLGLFWFWAANLIGDDDDNEPPATVEVANNPTPTPTAVVSPTETPVPQETPPAGADDEDATEEPEEEATEPPEEEATEPPEEEATEEPASSEDGAYQPGDLVVITTDDVNIRSDAGISAETLGFQLQQGQELEIQGGPVEADGLTWYQVAVTTDTGTVVGWVAEAQDGVPFFEPAPEE